MWFTDNFAKMTQDDLGRMIFNESDLVDLVMRDQPLHTLGNILVDSSVTLDPVAQLLTHMPTLELAQDLGITVQQFDAKNQQQWHMPQEYQDLDIADHVLAQCKNDTELQRCGHELLMYQERGLFPLLRYLKYLVDVMTQNQIIWGVGRGSSVASYVLYKLGVHRIDSMFYDLDPGEFLR